MSDVSAFWIALVAGVAALSVLVVISVWLARRHSKTERPAIAGRILALPLRSKLRLAVALVRDRRIPLAVRLVLPGLVLYLATPIDVIPDFIPVVGHLDDLLVVLIGIGLLLRFTPRDVLEEQVRRLEAGSNAT